MIRSNITTDIEESLQYLDKEFDFPNHYSIGISMGANRITKYAGLTKSKCRFKAMVPIACPFDMCDVVEGLIQPGNDLCNFGLTNGVQNLVMNNYAFLKKHEKDIGLNIDIDECLKKVKINEMQAKFTIPINGFKSRQNFENDQSCYYVIKDIKIPTLFIHSLDDPVC